MYITDKDGNYIPSATVQGEDGKEVELRVYNGYIQWKREDTLWTNLINMDVLQGKPGDRILLHAESYIIQYKYESDSEWTNLVDLSEYFGNAAAAKAAQSAYNASLMAMKSSSNADKAATNANEAAELAKEAAASTGSFFHAQRHAIGGEDPITPADIGAAEEHHTHNESDPTVPDWAKSPNKPSYTASEVGAAPNSHTHSLESLGAEAAKLSFQSITVPMNNWIEADDSKKFPYRATLSLQGVEKGMVASVFFNLADSESGLYSSGGSVFDGGICLYAVSVPDHDITIDRIIVWG